MANIAKSNFTLALLVLLGLVAAVAGISIGEADDAPGAAAIGIALLLMSVTLAVRAIRKRKS